VRTRPAVLLVVLLVVLGLAVSGGCKRSEVAAPTSSAEPSSDSAQILAEVRKYQEATGSDLRALVEEVKRQQSVQTERAGDPPVVRDLAVARTAVADAKLAVDSKSTESEAAALGRLQRACLYLAAELPAVQVAQQVDRALQAVRQTEAVASREFMVASMALLAASAAAVNGRPPALVPDVLKELDAAKASLDAGKPDEARKSLAAVLDKTSTHPSVVVLAQARQAVAGAQEALGRQAWPVVAAELTELQGRLDELAVNVGLKETGAAKKETAAQPAAAPQPQQPAAAVPAEKGGATQAPAAGPAPAPPAATAQPAAAQPAAAPAPAPAPSATEGEPSKSPWWQPWKRK
jgi:hypothetical protein